MQAFDIESHAYREKEASQTKNNANILQEKDD